MSIEEYDFVVPLLFSDLLYRYRSSFSVSNNTRATATASSRKDQLQISQKRHLRRKNPIVSQRFGIIDVAKSVRSAEFHNFPDSPREKRVDSWLSAAGALSGIYSISEPWMCGNVTIAVINERSRSKTNRMLINRHDSAESLAYRIPVINIAYLSFRLLSKYFARFSGFRSIASSRRSFPSTFRRNLSPSRPSTYIRNSK